jgi:hypothetical protein
MSGDVNGGDTGTSRVLVRRRHVDHCHVGTTGCRA